MKTYVSRINKIYKTEIFDKNMSNYLKISLQKNEQINKLPSLTTK